LQQEQSLLDVHYSDGIVNANHYGVPQHRRRYLLIATRLHEHVSLPVPHKKKTLTVRGAIGWKSGLPVLAAGELDGEDRLHRAAILSKQNLKRIRKTPPNGGNRSSWSGIAALQLDAYKDDDEMFADVYGRMYWDRPHQRLRPDLIVFQMEDLVIQSSIARFH